MGYRMTQGRTSFLLRKQHHQAAFEALKALCARTDLMTGESWRDGEITERHFAFTDLPSMEAATTLAEMMTEWRWKPIFDVSGDIVHVHFTGANLGDDEDMWRALAPFIENGSEIVMHGQHDDAWTWRFANGAITES